MALKPVNKRNGLDSKQAVWDAIRRLMTFTIREVREETVLSLDYVREYCLGLAAAGYIAETDESTAMTKKPGVVTIWELVNDIGIDAPRVRKNGTPVTQGDGRKNMWEAMRIIRIFTSRELAVAASMPDCLVQESTAADYAKHLCHAGYLKKTGDRYQFLPSAYTGPMAPQIQRTKRVWDPNQQKVRWRSDVEVGDDEH